MKLGISRVIIFAKDMEKMASFYGSVLGLPCVETVDDSAEFVSFDAGAIDLALHGIPEKYARSLQISDPPVAREGTPIKVAFGVESVNETRRELESRGATMGPVREFGALQLCDGTDPEGNIFQLSNRESAQS